MGRKSKDKGARGERELAAELQRLFGVANNRARGVSQDETALPCLRDGLCGVHVEVKRTERLSLYPAMRQAAEDAGVDKVPIVLHRSNGKGWLAIVCLNDLPKLAALLAELTESQS